MGPAPRVAPVASLPRRERPFWSVLIPCYNHAELLPAVLESVLAQDPGPESMQIEVVDDASSVGDAESVVRSVGGGRVGYFRQPRNVGAAANFTTCARRSTGHWVHVLHADDMVLPGFYRTYRDCIQDRGDLVMVGGNSTVIDADGKPRWPSPKVETGDGLLVDPAVTIATVNPLRCVSAVIARSAYEKWGAFRSELIHANDWELWTRMASHGPVGWVEQPLGLYREHDLSDSARLHRSTGYISDCLRAVDLMTTYFPSIDAARVRRMARRNVCEYALSVGNGALSQGHPLLAAQHALRIAVIDVSRDVRNQTGRLLWGAIRSMVANGAGLKPTANR